MEFCQKVEPMGCGRGYIALLPVAHANGISAQNPIYMPNLPYGNIGLSTRTAKP